GIPRIAAPSCATAERQRQHLSRAHLRIGSYTMTLLAYIGAALVAAPVVLAQDMPQARMLSPGVISTANNEFGGAISADGRTLMFSSGLPHYYGDELYMSHRLPDGGW